MIIYFGSTRARLVNSGTIDLVASEFMGEVERDGVTFWLYKVAGTDTLLARVA